FFEQPPLHDFPDRAHRRLLRHPANLRELVSDVVPDVAPALQFEQVRFLDREWPLPDWRSKEGDVFCEVAFRPPDSNTAALIAVQIEHQSAEEQPMPLRMLLHAALYWQEGWRLWEQQRQRGQRLRLRVVVPIVFHTGPQPWQNNRRLSDLVEAPPGLERFVPPWGPEFWDLANCAADVLEQSPGAWMS